MTSNIQNDYCCGWKLQPGTWLFLLCKHRKNPINMSFCWIFIQMFHVFLLWNHFLHLYFKGRCSNIWMYLYGNSDSIFLTRSLVSANTKDGRLSLNPDVMLYSKEKSSIVTKKVKIKSSSYLEDLLHGSLFKKLTVRNNSLKVLTLAELHGNTLSFKYSIWLKLVLIHSEQYFTVFRPNCYIEVSML